MSFIRIARVDEIPRGHTAFFRVGNKPLLIARVDKDVFALHGICPHRGNPLEGATVLDHLLDCPWHHFQYDVRTGENYFPKNVYPDDLPRLQAQLRPLRKYPVEIRDGDIWVDLE